MLNKKSFAQQPHLSTISSSSFSFFPDLNFPLLYILPNHSFLIQTKTQTRQISKIFQIYWWEWSLFLLFRRLFGSLFCWLGCLAFFTIDCDLNFRDIFLIDAFGGENDGGWDIRNSGRVSFFLKNLLLDCIL